MPDTHLTFLLLIIIHSHRAWVDLLRLARVRRNSMYCRIHGYRSLCLDNELVASYALGRARRTYRNSCFIDFYVFSIWIQDAMLCVQYGRRRFAAIPLIPMHKPRRAMYRYRKPAGLSVVVTPHVVPLVVVEKTPQVSNLTDASWRSMPDMEAGVSTHKYLTTQEELDSLERLLRGCSAGSP